MQNFVLPFGSRGDLVEHFFCSRSDLVTQFLFFALDQVRQSSSCVFVLQEAWSSICSSLLFYRTPDKAILFFCSRRGLVKQFISFWSRGGMTEQFFLLF